MRSSRSAPERDPAVILALGCLAAVVAAVIQRVTGLAFVLVLIGPVVLIHGPSRG